MDMDKFVSILLQTLILLPGAASCYLPVKSRMKHSPAKTAALCTAVILPYSLAASLLCMFFSIDINGILFLSLVLFFFLYRRTVELDLSCSLAVYAGVCAIETFPAHRSAVLRLSHPEHTGSPPVLQHTLYRADAAAFPFVRSRCFCCPYRSLYTFLPKCVCHTETHGTGETHETP